MPYPEKPENRIIIKMDDNPEHDIDLFDEFKMFLVDGYTVDPPSPKTYIVDIPGGNGSLDLTDSLLGDCAYENRKQEFTFYIVDVEDTMELEQIKTKVHNFLHGKDFDYIGTVDGYWNNSVPPEGKYYKYHGRFTISNLEHSKYANVDIAHQMKITIESDPFKYRDVQTRSISALGGTEITFKSGRKSVQPIGNIDGGCRIIFKGKQYDLKQGIYIFPDIVFREGNNRLYISTYPAHSMTGGELKNGFEGHEDSVTGGEFKTKKLFEGYKTGPGYVLFTRGMDVAGTTGDYGMDKGYRGQDFIYREDIDYPVIITVKGLKGSDGDIIKPGTDRKFRGDDFPFTDESGIFGEAGKVYEKWQDMLYKGYTPITINDVKMEYEGGDL